MLQDCFAESRHVEIPKVTRGGGTEVSSFAELKAAEPTVAEEAVQALAGFPRGENRSICHSLLLEILVHVQQLDDSRGIDAVPTRGNAMDCAPPQRGKDGLVIHHKERAGRLTIRPSHLSSMSR
eukprot:scaffold2914_cov156-Ochromonas_danica.AAC.17